MGMHLWTHGRPRLTLSHPSHAKALGKSSPPLGRCQRDRRWTVSRAPGLVTCQKSHPKWAGCRAAAGFKGGWKVDAQEPGGRFTHSHLSMGLGSRKISKKSLPYLLTCAVSLDRLRLINPARGVFPGEEGSSGAEARSGRERQHSCGKVGRRRAGWNGPEVSGQLTPISGLLRQARAGWGASWVGARGRRALRRLSR
jgi:hypothetical protein